jgi:hypothetical protein
MLRRVHPQADSDRQTPQMRLNVMTPTNRHMNRLTVTGSRALAKLTNRGGRDSRLASSYPA